MKRSRALLVPVFSVFVYYSTWGFEDCFRPLNFTITGGDFVASAALQFFRTTAKEVSSAFRVGDRVYVRKPLPAALRPLVVHLINFVDVNEMVNDP